MTETVAQMTKDELRQLIETAVEQKLLEILDDPDRGFIIEETIRDRLVHQQHAVAAGERGKSFDEVVHQLGLE